MIFQYFLGAIVVHRKKVLGVVSEGYYSYITHLLAYHLSIIPINENSIAGLLDDNTTTDYNQRIYADESVNIN